MADEDWVLEKAPPDRRENWHLDTVTFAPHYIEAEKDYERFDLLIKRANVWLRLYNHVKVKTCESITCESDRGCIDTETSILFEYGIGDCPHIRALRLWVIPKEQGDPLEAVQIGHFNLLPNQVGTDPSTKQPHYEKLDAVFQRQNDLLHLDPWPGEVITIESLPVKLHVTEEEEYIADADDCAWHELSHGKYLNIIRVFYCHGPPAYQEIGFADFKPELIDGGSSSKLPHYASWEETVDRAKHFLQSQTGIHVTNVQNVNCEIKSIKNDSAGYVDTLEAFFVRERKAFKSSHQAFLRVLRVCYTKPKAAYDDMFQPVTLAYRTFVPCVISTALSCSRPRYETVNNTMERIEAWIKLAGVKVLCVETVTINQNQDEEDTVLHPHMDQSQTRKKSTELLKIIRMYIDGDYMEPDPEFMPLDPDKRFYCDCTIL